VAPEPRDVSRPDLPGDESGTTGERPAPLGDLIGRRWTTQFRIVRLIGCGGMGEVWAAASDDIPGQLAVKAISSEHAHHREVVARHLQVAARGGDRDDAFENDHFRELLVRVDANVELRAFEPGVRVWRLEAQRPRVAADDVDDAAQQLDQRARGRRRLRQIERRELIEA